MKKAILIALSLICFCQAYSQNGVRRISITNSRINSIAQKGMNSLSLKNYLIAKKEFKKTSKDMYKTSFSMDLLDGKGIHLITLSKFGPIPSMNIGTQVTASLKIII